MLTRDPFAMSTYSVGASGGYMGAVIAEPCAMSRAIA